MIEDLALILVVAGLVTLLFRKLRQPIVLGYIVAGFLVSPHMPYLMSVVDKADVQTWADIGVLFLLFALGLDFSFKKILRMGLAPVIAALVIIFCMMVTGTLTGRLFGWSRMDCLFLAGMLAMSSTTIIYKACDDLGLRQQRFANLVMSVLILEDVLAVVMMVMLSTMAGGAASVGGMMIGSIVKIVFFLVLWFVVGIFLIPPFLRRMRRLMDDETLVVVALGLCCAMAVISTTVGFSSAFGAFVMGSILAETIEADKIMRVVEPVKNLFGAVFFVSVGMLVDPHVLAAYALPIAVIVVAIIVGQAIFGTMGFMLSGQPLKTAMQCGFSMAQIGEFAFIIASLGLSLGVIADFLYPVVVAVSVITTFLTPYMMKASLPTYAYIERRLPRRWLRMLNHLGTMHHASRAEAGHWRTLLRAMAWNVVVYSILSAAVVAVMLTTFLPFMRRLLPGWDLHWWANGITGVLTVALISPFLRSMVMKKNHSEEFKALWTESRLNRLPLIFTILARIVVAASFVFYICNYLTRFQNALIITLSLVVIFLIALSRWLKHRSIRLERLFVQNLRSRDIAAQVSGRRRPLFEGHLLDRDIHISDFDIPSDSQWAGKTLRELALGTRFGVHVSSILRGSHRINIPDGDMMIFVGDRLQAIGDDEQLNAMNVAMQHELVPEDADIEQREMRLHRIVVSSGSPLINKTVRDAAIRQRFGCMVVGVEEGQKNLTMINPARRFQDGEIIWIVGEEQNVERLGN